MEINAQHGHFYETIALLFGTNYFHMLYRLTWMFGKIQNLYMYIDFYKYYVLLKI